MSNHFTHFWHFYIANQSVIYYHYSDLHCATLTNFSFQIHTHQGMRHQRIHEFSTVWWKFQVCICELRRFTNTPETFIYMYNFVIDMHSYVNTVLSTFLLIRQISSYLSVNIGWLSLLQCSSGLQFKWSLLYLALYQDYWFSQNDKDDMSFVGMSMPL